MNRTITTKEFEMPVSALIEVADILIENELHHNIIATDEENESVTIEIEYEKEDRDAIHQIQDIIDDNEESDDDEDDDDDNEEENENL